MTTIKKVPNSYEPIIGFVKFFDINSDFGFILANNYGISCDETKPNRIISFYLAGSEWKSDPYPRDNEWVIFTPKSDRRGWRATDVKRISPDSQTLLKAFEYRGKFARIEGFDKKHDSYNINVINRVVSILAKDGVNQAIANTLADYIELSNADQRDAIIDELVSDKDIRNCLLKLVTSGIELSKTEGTISLCNKMVSSVFEEDSYDTDIIVKLWNAGYDLADYFDKLRYALNLWAESDSGKGCKFLKAIKLEGFQRLYLEEHHSQINDSLLLLLRKVYGKKFTEYLAETENLKDEYKILCFLDIADINLLNRISSWDAVATWCNKLKPAQILDFVKNYVAVANFENENFLKKLDAKLVVNAIKTAEEAEQYQLLKVLPDDYARNLVIEEFAETNLYKQFVEEWWNTEKAEVPYIVFDLETDGETIKEFAFLKENNTRSYESEDQLRSLGRALNRQDIVVGHNIKEWDLPILAKKGITTNQFVWDTLEIEILLNPCRYAYSLHTKHNAAEDTELTNELFWNQLYRLSKDKSLCDSLRDFLPAQIKNILATLQQDIYAEYFKKTAKTSKQFFQELRSLDSELEKKLKEIAKLSTVSNPYAERVLLIAPKSLWSRIAQYIPVQYPSDATEDYKVINREALDKHPLDNKLWDCVLTRFCDMWQDILLCLTH